MDVREKLVKLMIEAKKADTEDAPFSEFLADFMIANGVTVQEWISVEDRLPDNDDIVMVIASGKVGNITLVNAFKLATYSIDEGWILEMWPEWEEPKVTYWMPLPQPPEEGTE